MSIRILATGGTIDKIHDPITESLIFTDRSHIADMVSVFNVPNLKFSLMMLKDSFDITNNDRESILSSVQKSTEDKIVITHGTSTMVETAKFLANHVIDKTIVLTGAMRPYSLFQSDSEFNLGCAITAVQTIGNGVYITMNGQVFDHDNVRKDTKTGTFEKTTA